MVPTLVCFAFSMLGFSIGVFFTWGWLDWKMRKEDRNSVPFPVGDIRGLEPGEDVSVRLFVCGRCLQVAQMVGTPLSQHELIQPYGHGTPCEFPYNSPADWRRFDGHWFCQVCSREVMQLAMPDGLAQR